MKENITYLPNKEAPVGLSRKERRKKIIRNRSAVFVRSTIERVNNQIRGLSHQAENERASEREAEYEEIT